MLITNLCILPIDIGNKERNKPKMMNTGWLKDAVDYRTFFILVMFFCAITFLVTYFIKIDPNFGKNYKQASPKSETPTK